MENARQRMVAKLFAFFKLCHVDNVARKVDGTTVPSAIQTSKASVSKKTIPSPTQYSATQRNAMQQHDEFHSPWCVMERAHERVVRRQLCKHIVGHNCSSITCHCTSGVCFLLVSLSLSWGIAWWQQSSLGDASSACVIPGFRLEDDRLDNS